jgi:hypothetical protein
MAVLPDLCRNVADPRCVSCGRVLTINEEAFFYDCTLIKEEFLLGSCCVEKFGSAFIQDWARVLESSLPPYKSPWRKDLLEDKRERINLAAEEIANTYQYLIDFDWEEDE